MKPALPRCVLDSGGLTALVGHSQAARLRLRWVLSYAGKIRVPTPILIESTTGDGARDAEVNRIMNALTRNEAVIVAVDEDLAREAGRLRHNAKSDDGVDAVVAAVAVGDGSPAVVLTSDPHDLERRLAHSPHVMVRAV